MAVNLKEYVYTKGSDPTLDAQLAAATAYGKIRPGTTALFWKAGLRWYCIPFANVRRIFRRVEPVYGKLCCGSKSFFIERLVLILTDGTELELHIGDDVKKQAEALLLALKEAHPELQFGKE